MISKVQEKEKAIRLRRKGYTYREILKEVDASKSSISLWLKDTPLTNEEKRILKDRKNADVTRWRVRAAASRKKKQELRNDELLEFAKGKFLKNIDDPFFQVGISLYWAEGAKRTNAFSFINSDPDMINLMLKWAKMFLVESNSEIKMRVFTHKAFSTERHDLFWSKETGIPLPRFGKTIYKSHGGLIVKKRPNYHGCVRIEIGKVKYLREMLFWQQMLVGHYKK